MGTARVDHQKDVIGLVFSQRLGRQARQKQIDAAQTREGRSGRGFRRNELQVGQRRDANWFATAPWLPEGLSRFERSEWLADLCFRPDPASTPSLRPRSGLRSFPRDPYARASRPNRTLVGGFRELQ